MAPRRLGWLLFAAVVCCAATGIARAEAPPISLRVDRVDVEPYLADLARVRAYANVLTIEGSLVDNIKPEEIGLQAGNAKLKHIPGVGRFLYSGEPLDVVFVVEVHQSFQVALEDLGEALYKIISKMPKATTRVGLVTYGEVLRSKNLGDPAIAARAARKIAADDIPQPPVLVEALLKAVKLHTAAKPLGAGVTPRKLIVVISDGNNEDAQDDATMDLFRKVWKNARDAGVVIHSIAYSFTDARLPLRNLGEISKKTGGTFRWARARSDVVGHLDSVMNEINRQMVLTFYLPSDTVDGKPLTLICRSPRCGAEPLESPEIRPQPLRCAGAACGAGHACIAGACTVVTMAGARGGGWWIWLVLLLAVGGGAAVVLRKKKRGAAKREATAQRGAPGMPVAGQPAPPAAGYGGAQVVLPDFSKIPYLANSPGVQQLQQQLANIPYVAQHMAAQAAAAQGMGAQPHAAAPPARGAQLMVLSGPRQGQTLPLRHGFTVGRTPGCDLVIDDGMTSGHHAQFHFDTAGGVSVVDLGSTNGTYVNGVRQMQARLANGMSVRIGQTEIRFLQG